MTTFGQPSYQNLVDDFEIWWVEILKWGGGDFVMGFDYDNLPSNTCDGPSQS
jgi:hypothetical protein